ncbi:PorT family protein [Myroides albus]|uniref:porin family protein n=1 Tax=Myroides albus TaxID=2562892 RepID=UPI002158D4BF|nr:porin family protein [Myroides albus]UVD79575.1 PorT family protein [Myroides albus]
MKKITLSLIAVLTIGFAANAQEKEIKFGAKVGLNESKFSNADGLSTRTSFHIGAVAEIPITEKFSIQPELLYSGQGAKFDGAGSYDDGLLEFREVKVEGTFKQNYILLPIMAKYYVWKGLNLQAGPQIGFLTTAKLHYDKVEIPEAGISANNHSVSIKQMMNKVDFGLNFGIGYELPIGVFFDLRANIGLSSINKEGASSKNQVSQLSVGYKF